MAKLIERRNEGLFVCEVVWAETRPAFANARQHSEMMRRLDLTFSPLDEKAAALAGE